MTVYISNSAVTRSDTLKIGKLFLSVPVALSLFWRYSNKVTIYASFQALGLLQLAEIFQACVKHFKEFPFAKFVLFEVCLFQFVRNVQGCVQETTMYKRKSFQPKYVTSLNVPTVGDVNNWFVQIKPVWCLLHLKLSLIILLIYQC